jgi:S1-C subfamily serine protease
MNKRLLIILGIVAALILTIFIGAAAGGGIVYTLTHTTLPAFASQTTEADPNSGLIITGVAPDSPASDAGIVRGDILLEMNGQEVNTITKVRQILSELKAGDKLRLTLLHGDELLYRTLELEDGDQGKMGITLCCGKDESPVSVLTTAVDSLPLIFSVMEGSPAEEAGLKVGEFILSVDGVDVDLEHPLADLIASYSPGDRVTLEVRQTGEEEFREVSVELGEHPEQEGKAYLGIRFRLMPDITFELDQSGFLHGFSFENEDVPFPFLEGSEFPSPNHPNIPFISPSCIPEDDLSGVFIRDIYEGGPADKVGLQEDDLIVEVDGEPVTDPEGLSDTISSYDPGTEVVISVFRPDECEQIEFEVRLGEHPEEEGKGYLGVVIGGQIRIERDDELPSNQNRFFRFDITPFEFDLPESQGA